MLDFLFGYGGLGLAVMGGGIATAVFLPAVRRLGIEIAVVAAIATTVYGKGHLDGEAYVQGKWDRANAAAVERAKDARVEAERTVRDDGAKPGRVSDDEWLRD